LGSTPFSRSEKPGRRNTSVYKALPEPVKKMSAPGAPVVPSQQRSFNRNSGKELWRGLPGKLLLPTKGRSSRDFPV